MKRVNFYLPETQIVWLKMLRSITGISVSEHIRRAITMYMLTDERTTWKNPTEEKPKNEVKDQ